MLPILTSTKARKNNFNFLRLIFASLVLLAHAYELIDGNRNREILTSAFGTLSFGEFAVDGFFLLSGYLIFKSWHLTPEIRVFLKKRIARIYPGFIVASFVSVFFFGPLGAPATKYFQDLSIAKFFYNSLTLAVPYTPPVFSGQPYPYINGSMWTIRYEFGCYIMVIAAGLLRLVDRPRALLALAFALMLTVFSQSLNIHLDAFGKEVSFSSPFWRLALYFVVGGCFYIWRRKIIFTPKIAIFSAALLIWTMTNHVVVDIGLALLGGYLVFYFAQAEVPALEVFQRTSDVSYGLYLYGWPVQKLIIWFAPALHPILVFATSLLVCVFAGYLSWHFIEKRFLVAAKTLRVQRVPG